MMSDEVAIVTGAGGGIGSETVRALLGDGRSVAAFDVSNDILEQIPSADSGRLLPLEVDVTDSGAVDAAFERVVAELGPPGTLVNIAGTNRVVSLADTTEQLWDLLIDLNLKGTFLCCKTAVPYMRQLGGGRIVNMSSIFGIRGEVQQTAYAASKAGVIGLTRALAIELAPDQILVNALAPVMTLTPRVAGLAADHKERQLSKIPLGRYGTVDDIVGTISFLLSEAGSFYTGQTFSANGGDTMP
ncbi:MAG: SDR family oxidoreductase [Acidimicrobiia bacterium]|nr:SDR family oxidoreductase [Acidimicrobiia bacterium]